MQTNVARTLAALSATNEAILYAKTPEQLYQQVCEAAVFSGDFLAKGIFLLEAATEKKQLSEPEPGAMCYMMSKQGYLSDHDGHSRPHLMFFTSPTEPGVPVLRAHRLLRLRTPQTA